MNELKALEAAAPRAPDPRFADATRRRPPGRGLCQVEHLQPMLSLDNAYDEEDLRAFDERVRKGLALEQSPGVRGGAQDRWPQHGADLRRRPAGARRHARRRHARRRRHAERPHRSRHSVVAAEAARRAASRFAARSIFRRRTSSGSTRSRKRPASRCTRIRGTRRRARCAISIRRWSRSAVSRRGCISWCARPRRSNRMPRC